MRRIIITLLVLAVVVGALYGAAKGFMYYRVKTALDDLALQASGQGTLRHGDIDTDLRGSVTVHDLVFEPNDGTPPLRAGRVRVTGPDALFFLDPRNDWNSPQGKPPPRLRFHVEQLALPIPVAQAGDADACRTGGLSDPGVLQALDLSAPLLDSEFGWDLDPGGLLETSLGFDLSGVESLNASVQLEGFSPNVLQGEGAMPRLRRFDLTFRVEPAFGNKFALECARRRGISPDEYKAALLGDQLQSIEAAGLQLGEGLKFALRQFYENWGEVRLSARPVSPVGAMSLMFLPPTRLAETLNLSLRVNDSVISDLGFTLKKPEAGSESAAPVPSLGSLVGAAPPPELAPKRPARPRVENYWVDVAPAALAGQLGREVRLHTAGNPPRTGLLESLQGGVAAVQQRLHGGRFTALVPVAEVTRAEVRRQRVVQAPDSTP